MSSQDALAYLEAELGKQMAEFDSSRKFYRSTQLYMTMATAALSGVTTVLVAGGRIVNTEWWFILPLLCSASITVAAAYDGFLKPKEMWIQKTDTRMALQNIAAHIKYAKSKSACGLSQQEVDEFTTALIKR